MTKNKKTGVTPYYIVGTVVLSLAAQVVAIFIFPVFFAVDARPIEEFIVLLVGSIFLTPLSIWFHMRQYYAASEICFWIRAFLVVVSGIPLGMERWPQVLLILSLITEAAALHGTVSGSLICLSLIVIELASQGERRVWGEMIPGNSLEAYISSAMLYSMYAAVMVVVSRQHRKLIDDKKNKQRLRNTVERLVLAGEDFLSYAHTAEFRSAEIERKRITREIHDIAGYTLTNIRMMMEAGLRSSNMDQEEIIKMLSWVRTHAQEGQQEIRSILRLVRSEGDITVRGTGALLKAGRVFQKATRTSVVFEWGNISNRWIQGERDLLALRVLQEGLINSFLHGMASKVTVAFFEDNYSVKMVIRDDGKGANSVDMGIGLTGMQERINAIQGNFSISTDNSGFCLSIELPFCTEAASTDRKLV